MLLEIGLVIGAIVWAVIFVRRELGAHFAAKRMGLRDKGHVQPDADNLIVVCGQCRTRARIGVRKAGGSCRFCWRCEMVISGTDPDPKGRDDIPVDQTPKSTEVRGEVVPFEPKRRAGT